jgi:hypothetical protein
MMYIYNKKSIMGGDTLGLSSNVILSLVLVFTVAMAAAGIIGIMGQFN